MNYKGLIKRLMIQGKPLEEAQKIAEKQGNDLMQYYLKQEGKDGRK